MLFSFYSTFKRFKYAKGIFFFLSFLFFSLSQVNVYKLCYIFLHYLFFTVNIILQVIQFLPNLNTSKYNIIMLFTFRIQIMGSQANFLSFCYHYYTLTSNVFSISDFWIFYFPVTYIRTKTNCCYIFFSIYDYFSIFWLYISLPWIMFYCVETT